MRFKLLVSAIAIGLSGTVLAQIPTSKVPLYYEPSIPARIEAMPRGIPRARGPDLAYALQLAQAAVDACKARGKPVSVRVTDSVGTTVVLLSGDGAGEQSQLVTEIEALETARHQVSGHSLKEQTSGELDLVKQTNMEVIDGSALTLTSGATFVGVLAVSGAPGIDKACAEEARDKVAMPSKSSRS